MAIFKIRAKHARRFGIARNSKVCTDRLVFFADIYCGYLCTSKHCKCRPKKEKQCNDKDTD